MPWPIEIVHYDLVSDWGPQYEWQMSIFIRDLRDHFIQVPHIVEIGWPVIFQARARFACVLHLSPSAIVLVRLSPEHLPFGLKTIIPYQFRMGRQIQTHTRGESALQIIASAGIAGALSPASDFTILSRCPWKLLGFDFVRSHSTSKTTHLSSIAAFSNGVSIDGSIVSFQ